MADGQHPITGEQLVCFRLAHQHTNAQGEKVKTVEHRRLGRDLYRAELSLRLKQLGYEIEPTAKGAPEIKGYSQDYLDASSPRHQQIRDELQRQGFASAEAAEIAQHHTRAAKFNISHEEMQRRHQEMPSNTVTSPRV